MAAIGTVGYFLDKAPSLFFDVYGQKGKVQFFMASVVIGWVMVMALFSLFITGLHEKVSGINWLLCVSRCTAFVFQFHLHIETAGEKGRKFNNP